MNGLLFLLSLVILIVVPLLAPTEGAPAILVCVVFAAIAFFVIYKVENHAPFLLRLFVAALLVRMAVGTIIFIFGLQVFFGGDAITYDQIGYALLKYWQGDGFYKEAIDIFTGGEAAAGGWGMIYLIAFIYGIIGRNMLAIQFVNAVIGAATAPTIFLCAQHLFNNTRVSRVAAIFVAFYPSLVLWSSQGLKDGPIGFLLAISMLAALKLGEKLSVTYALVLASGMLGILSLRFYVFYMLVTAVVGSFVIGMRQISAQSIFRQFIIIIFLGLVITYLGVLRTASVQIETYGTLSSIQNSRADLAKTAATGFAADVDVSTTSGALSVIPIGLVYLLFAPFPWQLTNLRQSITLPEMLIWWTSFPLLILGLWFTIRYRLRQCLPILLFTSMLTLAYSLFQGNIGTAYRQRAQMLVFYFIFVAVGYILIKERREEKRQQDLMARQAARKNVISPLPQSSATNN